MAEVEVPPYFLCPVTLQIMRDPVTVCTGITYERDSIEKWIFSDKNRTCPVTKQILWDTDLTPNITLRRLIQSWCTMHAAEGVERLPTPKTPVGKAQILKLLDDAQSPQMQMNCLKRLKSIASQNQTNRRCLETAGTPQFLASLIVEKTLKISGSEASESESKRACDEALGILCSLQLSEGSLKAICDQEFIESLTRLMQIGNCESRVYAIMVLNSVLQVADPSRIIVHLNPKFFVECVRILRDEISQKTTKAALKVLINVCQQGRNRMKAVESGTVHVLIDLLIDSSDKRVSEMILVLLDFLCQSADGRADLLNHAAGLAIVSKKILRVSPAGSERAVKILHSISKFSATPGILQEMLQIGVVEKLCLLLQTDCGPKMREKSREMIKWHARAWRNSSCLPDDLICSIPSS